MFEFAHVDPSAPAVQALLREYYGEVLTRRYGRSVTDDEVTTAFRDDPNEGLAPPGGTFIVVTRGGETCGCAALRSVGDHIGEVKRVYVRPAARRAGLGTQLMDQIEDFARTLGLTKLRLDTRRDLAEARAMYLRRGYHDTARFNDSQLAEVWLERDFGPGQ